MTPLGPYQDINSTPSTPTCDIRPASSLSVDSCSGSVSAEGVQAASPAPSDVQPTLASPEPIHSSTPVVCPQVPSLIIPAHIPSSVNLPDMPATSISPFPVCPGPGAQADTLLRRPQPSAEFAEKAPGLARIYSAVTRVGLPNYRGAHVRHDSALNISEWRRNIFKCRDQTLPDLLEFGFPIGFEAHEQPATGLANHSSATANPIHVRHYLATECKHKAIIGPFATPPFQPWWRTNPLMTRPKQDSDKLRVILDLSFPDLGSVNAGIPSGSLDGADFKLRLPTPFTLAARIKQLGPGCLLYKIDLSRAYRQLRSDPLDWALLGINWEQEEYIDVAVPFGLRHGASACQRTTEAVAQMAYHDVGATADPYVDDTARAALAKVAGIHYQAILDTMALLGLDPALAKCQEPMTTLLWIGVMFDSIAMSMSIAPHKIQEAASLCHEFLAMQVVTRRKMETLMGKIHHAIKCGARRFTSRMLALLRTAVSNGRATVTEDARLDARWLAAFLPSFNGLTLIKPDVAQRVAEVDSCLEGGGGYCHQLGYYHMQYPPSITICDFSIASLECFNLLVAVRLWIVQWTGLITLLFSDNWAVVCALQSGRANDPLIQACIREIWWLAATNDVELVVRHRPGAELQTADTLSRICTRSTSRFTDNAFLETLSVPPFEVCPRHLAPPLLI